MVSQKTLFPVIPFHHLSDCDLYTPPTAGREAETEAGGDENDYGKPNGSEFAWFSPPYDY